MSNAILQNSKFIHIPKCGGTSIQSILWNVGCIKDKDQEFTTPHNGHLFASQMPQDNRVNFTFVRNPITWWHSWYHWNKMQPLSRFSGDELKSKSFDQWIDDYGQFWLGKFTMLVKRYLGEDANFPTTNKVTKIGKTEHLYKDLINILDEIGEPYNAVRMQDLADGKVKMPPTHTNAQVYDRKDISSATKSIIYKTEKEIFTKFNYGTDI